MSCVEEEDSSLDEDEDMPGLESVSSSEVQCTVVEGCFADDNCVLLGVIVARWPLLKSYVFHCLCNGSTRNV